jgi:cephalosporin hydroxylase
VRITIDTNAREVGVADAAGERKLDLYSREAFEVISDVWLKTSWNQKYSYTFTWLGRPIIQHPEDLVRFQEVVWDIKPDIIVETGVAHGGSLILSASLLRAMNNGRKVIGVDIEIRSHNRAAIEAHVLAPLIALIEGDSVAPSTLARVKALIRPSDKVLVVLDSNHSKRHVAAELEAYHDLVTPGSYIVATDGIMQSVFDAPLGREEWRADNPAAAARDFAAAHSDFLLERPRWRFNESAISKSITAWPDAWLRRIR